MKLNGTDKSVFSALNCGILILDRQYNIHFQNQWINKHSEINGESDDNNLLHRFPETIDSRLLNAIDECFDNHTPGFLSSVFHQSPLNFVKKHSKKLIKQDINVLPLYQHDEMYCLLQINDVTSRSNRESALEKEVKRRQIAEESLRKSESRLQAILDNSPFIISMSDLEGKIILSNQQHQNINVGDKNIPEEIETRLSTEDKICGTSVIKTMRPLEIEQNIHHPDQTEHTYQTIKFPVIEQDKLSGVGSISLDISDKKEAERQHRTLHQQLLQAQKMDSIGQLTGGIAHDFNNILTSVIGYTQLSIFSLEQQQPENLSQYLDEILQASNKAKNLVEQMLAFSRGEEIKKLDTDVKQVVNSSMSMLSSTLPKTIRLSSMIEPDLPIIQAHPVQLSQIILNLAINARDAISNHGKINIGVQKKEIQPQLCNSCHTDFSGSFISILVTDDGPGMNEEVRSKIFEPFFSTKPIGKGTGMGLSSVHGIIHGLDGHISVRSEPNKGCEFEILLPTD
jgi:signal transduction histidine kinase